MTTKSIYGVARNTANPLLYVAFFMAILISGTLQAQKKQATAKMDYNLDPTYGEITLGNEISTDVHKIEITSGGSVNASYQGDDCSGYVSEAPDYRLHFTGSISQLIIGFVANIDGEDATILVNQPDGTWICNDDADTENLNPIALLNSPATGQYDIWVGSYEDGKYIEGTLLIVDSELINQIETKKTTLNYELEPHFSSFKLKTGFEPDPFSISGTSGGEVDVSAMDIGSGCTGFAAEAPDYRLNWTGSTANLKIIFEATTSGEDAVLIINTPDGSWICNDDANDGTLNPMVLLNGQDEGQFDIWVASLTSGAYIEGKLIVTEHDVTPK